MKEGCSLCGSVACVQANKMFCRTLGKHRRYPDFICSECGSSDCLIGDERSGICRHTGRQRVPKKALAQQSA